MEKPKSGLVETLQAESFEKRKGFMLVLRRVLQLGKLAPPEQKECDAILRESDDLVGAYNKSVAELEALAQSSKEEEQVEYFSRMAALCERDAEAHAILAKKFHKLWLAIAQRRASQTLS